jgi:hypothetical protein
MPFDIRDGSSQATGFVKNERGQLRPPQAAFSLLSISAARVKSLGLVGSGTADNRNQGSAAPVGGCLSGGFRFPDHPIAFFLARMGRRVRALARTPVTATAGGRL